MEKYQITYKCRLCGEEFSGGITGKDNAMREMALCVCDIMECKIAKHTIHFGEREEHLGIADFIGFRKVE